MTDALLDYALSVGLPLVGLLVFLGCLGLPVPSSIAMLFSAALVTSGDVSYPLLFVTCFGAAIIGDQAGFALGRYLGAPLFDKVRKSNKAAKLLDKAERELDKRGGLAVFFSRWLIAPVGPYVNLIAGAGGLCWRRFTVSDIAGELTWVAIYTGLGVAFASQVQLIADLAANLMGLLTALALAAFLIRWLLKRVKRRAERLNQAPSQAAADPSA